MKITKTAVRLFLVGFILVSGMPFVSEFLVSADEGLGFAPAGPGRHVTTLYAGQTIDAGTASVWNSREKLQIQVEALEGWMISEIQIYVGTDPVPTKKGNPAPGQFPYKKEYTNPTHQHTLVLDLEEDLAFKDHRRRGCLGLWPSRVRGGSVGLLVHIRNGPSQAGSFY
jgi:hypothetical protein